MYLDTMRFIEDKAVIVDRVNNAFAEVSCQVSGYREANSLTVFF